jgi:RimJ/RimL family protein N-acetyltransferase
VGPGDRRGRCDVGTLVLWKNDHDDPESELGWMVFPEFQGRGLGKRGVQMLLDEAGADGRWGAISAFPSVTNVASNAICRTLGFRLVDTTDFEYQGQTLVCNHWRIGPRSYRAPEHGVRGDRSP